MSLIDNNNTLLREQLGKGAGIVFTTANQTTKDFYAIHFVVESVIASITVADATGEAALHTTMVAGTTLFMNVTAITLTSGVGIGYYEGPTT